MRYQVIVYGCDYGADERPEIATLKGAKINARAFVEAGLADGALVYDLERGRVVYECGERFPARCRPIERLVTA